MLDRLEAPAGKDMLLRLGEEIRLDGADFDQAMLRERDRRIDGLTRRYLDTVKAAIVNDHHLEMEARVHHLAKATLKGSQPNDAVLADPARNAADVVRRLQERHRVGGETDDALVGPGFSTGGRVGLDRLHRYLDLVWEWHVRGGVATCGAGQGGAALFLAAFLEAHDQDPRPTLQRPLWVLDRFRRSAGGADLNVLRDRLARFGLLGDRVRLLQGDPDATAAELADQQLAVLHLGPGIGADAAALLELLYPRVASGGVVVIEPLEPAAADAIEAYRRRHRVTAPMERDGAGGLAWSKEEAVGTPQGTVAESRPGASRSPLVRPLGLVPPDLSVIVAVHNMGREARRSLLSLTRRYQQGLDGKRYEVIVVENGSDPDERLGPEAVESLGRPFRYIDLGDDATPSPVAAMNRGLAESRGRAVALMVDGAHVLTPGVLRHGLAGLDAYEPAIVATQAWYVGPGQQGDVMRAGLRPGGGGRPVQADRLARRRLPAVRDRPLRRGPRLVRRAVGEQLPLRAPPAAGAGRGVRRSLRHGGWRLLQPRPLRAPGVGSGGPGGHHPRRGVVPPASRRHDDQPGRPARAPRPHPQLRRPLHGGPRPPVHGAREADPLRGRLHDRGGQALSGPGG